MKNSKQPNFLTMIIITLIVALGSFVVIFIPDNAFDLVKPMKIFSIILCIVSTLLFCVCLYLYLKEKKNSKHQDAKDVSIKKIDIDSLPTKLELGAYAYDKVQYKFNDKKYALEIIAACKDWEELSSDEIDEINWLLSSEIINSEKIQKEILDYINKVYKSVENDFVKRTSLTDEMELTGIGVDIHNDNITDEEIRIVAFLGSVKCDEEHGISISFKSREFMSIQQETEYNYINKKNNHLDLLRIASTKNYIQDKNYVLEYLKARKVNDDFYLKLIKNNDFGILEDNIFVFKGNKYTLDGFASCASNSLGFDIIKANEYLKTDRGNEITIAGVRGDDVILMNIETGEILLWLIETGEWEKIHIANSLKEFMRLLRYNN